MIVGHTDRIYIAYYRTNRRVRWDYAEYAGRWETLERAIEEVRERLNGQRGEYRIVNVFTSEKAAQGFAN